MQAHEISKYDFRFLLIKEFQRRKSKNNSYSMRAFARQLSVSPAFICQIFNGKRLLSYEKAIQFSQKLSWPSKRKKLFLSLLQYQKASSEYAKESLLEQIHDFSELNFMELQHDQFQLIAEPHHFAIIELCDLKGFQENPDWIAKRLGITVNQAIDAIDRLKRIGLLVYQNEKLVKSTPRHRIKDLPSNAIKTFHLKHLKNAENALETQKFEFRDFSGITVALPKSKIPEIKDLIRDFRNKINSFCTKQTHPDSVYHLAVQFYQLDKETKP